MPKPTLYVLLSGSKIRVRPEQKKLVDDYQARRGVSLGQAMRDVLDFAETYGFFIPNGITNGQVSSMKDE